MKTTLLFLSVFLSASLFGQNDYNSVDVRIVHDTMAYFKRTMEPFTGIVKASNFEGEFLNGKAVGYHKRFNGEGQLVLKTKWIDGRKDGRWLSWYNNGQLKFERNYNKGLYSGCHAHYTEGGDTVFYAILTRGNGYVKEFNHNNIPWSKISINNSLSFESNIKNGKKDGVCKEYFYIVQVDMDTRNDPVPPRLKYYIEYKEGVEVNRKCFNWSGEQIICGEDQGLPRGG